MPQHVREAAVDLIQLRLHGRVEFSSFCLEHKRPAFERDFRNDVHALRTPGPRQMLLHPRRVFRVDTHAVEFSLIDASERDIQRRAGSDDAVMTIARHLAAGRADRPLAVFRTRR